MPTVLAVVTVDAMSYWPQFFGGLLGAPSTTTVVGTSWDPIIKLFKVGEGGWVNNGAGQVVRPPDPTLRRLDNNIQDIDAIVDPTRPSNQQRYPSTDRATFQKSLVLSDFTYISPNTVDIQCLLDYSDFNNDGFGNPPEIWEIGVFSDHPTVTGQNLMVAYGTFPQETKDLSVQLEFHVQIIFG